MYLLILGVGWRAFKWFTDGCSSSHSNMSSVGSRSGGLAPGGGHKSGLCLNCSRNLFCLVTILVPVDTPHFCCFFTSLDTLPTCQLYMSLLLLHPARDQSLPLWAPRLTCFSHCSICSASQHWPLHILSWGAHISSNNPWTRATLLQVDFLGPEHTLPHSGHVSPGNELAGSYLQKNRL